MAEQKSEPGLLSTLFEDFKDFFRNVSTGEMRSPIGRTFRELKEFYISEDRCRQLSNMGKFKRWFLTFFWLFKAMVLKLSPIRRIILVIGLFFIFRNDGSNGDDSNSVLFGAIVFFILLMLELKDKLVARSELQAGHAVQEALLPPTDPKVPGWEIWLHYRAANEVGGDLLDVQKVSEERHAISLGDVADKGLKAALLMAKLQATVRALAPDYDSLAKLAAAINRIYNRDSLPTNFASLIYVELAENSKQLRYVNAGHMPPIVIAREDVRELVKGDAALGLSPGATFREHSLSLNPGEVLILYSDGLTEARDESGELFGEERLLKLLKETTRRSPRDIGEHLVSEVNRFIGAAPRTDDLTLAIIRSA